MFNGLIVTVLNNVIELKKAISEEWNKIDQTYLANLIGTMNKRLIEVIHK